MSKFTIVSSVYNQYELLRQFIESIIHNVDPNSYEKVIIVDDFSKTSGKLREYENYINSHTDSKFDKFQIINFPEYRHTRWYQNGTEDKFDNERASLGVVGAYQYALEYTQTDYVILCDTDIVFLSKFQSILNQISELFDNNPKVMSISQLIGHSSNEIFESDIVGMKNMPNENGGAGGPSPMFSAFRIEAWTKHNLVPIASRPNTRKGNGFIEFFLSAIGNGFTVMNFPFYSGDYIFHLGGGTARRVAHLDAGFGHLDGCKYRYGPCADKYIHDYYTGAHRINMDANKFIAYLKNKYNIPVDKIAERFDESMLVKYQLHPQREVGFRPPHSVVVKTMEDLLDKNNPHIPIWEKYTYGKKSEINWLEF